MSVKLSPLARAAQASSEAAGCGAVRGGCCLVPAAPGGGEQGGRDHQDLHRGARCGSPPPTCSARRTRPGGSQVDGQDVQRWMVWLLGSYSDAYARQQYRALRQFFRWLVRRGRAPRPHGQAARADGAGEAGAVLHQRRTFEAGEGLPGQHVRTAARRGDHVGVPGDGHPAGRAGRDPLRPAATPAAATWTWSAGRSRSAARAARTGPSRSITRPPARVDRYLRVRARHEQAYRLGLWLGTGGRGPLTAQRDLPDGQAARRAGRGARCTRTGSGTTSAIPGSTAAARRAT